MKIDPVSTCAIVLAAGRGTRMNAGKVNKVTLKINGKAIILRTVEKIKNAGIRNIYVVVGHAKESVIEILQNKVEYAEQQEQLGTGHAVQIALKEIPKNIDNIFVFYGDDTSYNKNVLTRLYEVHKKNNNVLSFVTFEVDDPTGLGRIVREDGKLKGIIEEKDATPEERNIREINPGCFLFKKSFLERYISKIPLNEVKNEYYLTDLIEIGLKNKEKIEAVLTKNSTWQGVNTPDQLILANQVLV